MHSMKVRGECCKRRQVTVITLEMQDVSRLLSLRRAATGIAPFCGSPGHKDKRKGPRSGPLVGCWWRWGEWLGSSWASPSALTRCGASRSVVQNRSRRFCEPSRCCAAGRFASRRRHK